MSGGPETRGTAAPGVVPGSLMFLALYVVLAIPALRGGEMSAAALAASMPLAGALAVLSAIDLRSFRLPDAITLPLIAAGLVLAWLAWQSGVESALWRPVAAAAGFLFLYAVALTYRRLRGRDGLGLGDAKLLAAAGAWLGFSGLPTVMLWATGVALGCIAAAALMGRQVDGASRIPFGPFLALGFWMVWVYGAVG